MRVGLLPRVVLFVVCSAVSTAAFADDKTYSIHLSRPVKVGDQFSLAVSAKTVITTTPRLPVIGAATKREESVDLQCTERIIAIEPHTQDPVKLELKVDHFTRNDADLAAEGAMIVVENSGTKMLYTIDGNAVSTDMERALSLLTSVRSPTDTDSYDDTYGTPIATKIDDSWDMNPAILAKAFNYSNRKVDPANISGKGKLIDVEPSDHGPNFDVELNIKATKLRGDWSNGWKIADGDFTTNITRIVPVDDGVVGLEFRQQFVESLDLVRKDPSGKTSECLYKRDMSRVSIRSALVKKQ
jgi:hypothetical protein